MPTEPTDLNDQPGVSAPESSSEVSSSEASPDKAVSDTTPASPRSSSRRPTRSGAPLPSSDNALTEAMANIRRETGDFEFGALLSGVGTEKERGNQSRGEERHGEMVSGEPPPSVLPERISSDGQTTGPDSPPGESPAFRPVVPGPLPPAPPPMASPMASPSPRSGRSVPVAAWIGLALALAIPVGFFIGNSINGQRAVATTPPTPVARETTGNTTVETGAMLRKPGMPDPRLTPGDRLPQARAEVKVSEATRLQVLQAYGIDPSGEGQKMVMVRLIPAALGGTEEPANLFPTTPWFVDLKVRLDRYLTGEVKKGKMTVEEAEKILTTNWVAALHRYNIRNYGYTDPNTAKKTEEKLAW